MRIEVAPTEPEVLCFGEILWDFLPTGRFAGGAPFNVAYHLQHLGIAARVISAVGSDPLGDELLDYLALREVDAHGVKRHPFLPTGTVTASVGAQGDATYTIAAPVAWDEIALTDQTRAVVENCRALVFGSLAQRLSVNRQTLDELLTLLPSRAERVFDVNLRSPFDDVELVARYAKHATLLKLNDREAQRLAALSGEEANSEEAQARALAKRFGCARVCITAGDRGAGILEEGQWTWSVGERVSVVDTIGAGDAFLAALVASRLRNTPTTEGLREACRLGEWVASQKGATPEYRR